MGQVKWSELRGNRDYVALALERGFMVMVRRVGETRRRWVCRWEVQSNSATLDKRFTRCLFNSNSFAGPAALAELCSLLSVILLLHQIGSFTGSSSQSVCQSVSLSVCRFLFTTLINSLHFCRSAALLSVFLITFHFGPFLHHQATFVQFSLCLSILSNYQYFAHTSRPQWTVVQTRRVVQSAPGSDTAARSASKRDDASPQSVDELRSNIVHSSANPPPDSCNNSTPLLAARSLAGSAGSSCYSGHVDLSISTH